jgi:ATP-dependent Lhr-like helicase
VSAFDRLDPLVQHHIVNTLGWRELWPLQQASIGPVLHGQNCLLLAPTAGGKTEAAMFPLLSRMCNERWIAPSILYVCPLKALINNLGERLEKYTRMLGRTAAVWHGDISQSGRNQVRLDPADVLLTTPESLEAMLISSNAAMRTQLQRLQAVVVDEIHAFAGDDRGWHLLCVLERLAHLAGKDFQRVGLSATVGNPEELLTWLVVSSKRGKIVVQPENQASAAAEVTLDFVGSLENAAVVISRLHRGEKRLVFCDSRSRVESLAGLLRSAGIQVVVSHSSLSPAERRRAEEVFARGEDCVIVATSTLELGIDVGDLDRVVQIDSPTTVASFLQRLGRSGRRAGKSRNCLFLCTTEDALLQGAALLELWANGYVEPITPPPRPYHILAQQALAICLQMGGLAKDELLKRLRDLPVSRGIDDGDVELILQHLLAEQFLATDGARCFVGEGGENTFGRRNFLELVSVFTTPPVLAVKHGQQELGFVDQNLFLTGPSTQGRILSLGGRGWRIVDVDWSNRRVNVVPSEVVGKTVWFGGYRGLPFILCRVVRQVLTGKSVGRCWSQRAHERIESLRDGYSFLKPEATTIARAEGRTHWYTFAGNRINSALTDALKERGLAPENTDEYSLTFTGSLLQEQFSSAIKDLSAEGVVTSIEMSPETEQTIKFAQCVPARLRHLSLRQRLCRQEDLATVLNEPRCWVSAD